MGVIHFEFYRVLQGVGLGYTLISERSWGPKDNFQSVLGFDIGAWRLEFGVSGFSDPESRMQRASVGAMLNTS